jgi:hypothetical protein
MPQKKFILKEFISFFWKYDVNEDGWAYKKCLKENQIKTKTHPGNKKVERSTRDY